MRVEDRGNAARFGVRVQTRASASEVAGSYGDAVKVRLTAPPVEGEANDALVAFLADRLGVAKSAVAIVRGGRSRSKVVEVAGVTPASVRKALLEEGR